MNLLERLAKRMQKEVRKKGLVQGMQLWEEIVDKASKKHCPDQMIDVMFAIEDAPDIHRTEYLVKKEKHEVFYCNPDQPKGEANAKAKKT